MKIAYIDHSYHKKTNSTLFFIDLLKKNNHVDVYWCDYWKNKKTLDLSKIAKKKYDAFIFLQVFYPLKELEKIKDQNIIFIPMYDSVHLYFDAYWLKYRQYKFICFSKKLYNKLKKIGLDCIYVQYYLKTNHVYKNKSEKVQKKGINIFFWIRRGEITWKTVKNLLSKNYISECFIHVDSDPNVNIHLPSENDIKKYNIKFSHWFKNKKEYLDNIKKTDIFIAPRIVEGIGLSFIEAMSLGKCIIAPDRSTMNEYIENGYNGYLYNPFFIKPVELINTDNITKNILEKNEKGYKQWLDYQDKIFNFISKNQDNKKINLTGYFFIYLFGIFNLINAYYKRHGIFFLLVIIKSAKNKFFKKENK